VGLGVGLGWVGLFVVGYFAWKNMKEENELLRSQITEFQVLTESLARSSNTWATKDDLKEQLKVLFTKEELNLLKKDMNELDAELLSIGKTTGRIEKRISKLEKSDEVIPNPNGPKECPSGGLIDVHEYTKNIQVKNIEDKNTAPVARVKFDASKNTPWSYTVHARDHKIVTVVGKKDSGQLTFHHKLTYSVPEETGKKEYPIEVVSSDFQQLQLKNKMFWLNPILDVSVFIGGTVYQFAPGPGRDSILSAGADLGISLSSYGETKADSWLRLFRFGIGYNMERQAGHLSFAPLTFNIGKPMPLITNLYIMPMLAVDTAGGLTLNVGLGLQL
jgi:hypothetical protein